MDTFSRRTRPNPNRIRSRNNNPARREEGSSDAVARRSKSRSPSRAAVRNDPFGASMSMAKLSVGNRSSKSSNNSGSVRQSTSSNDIDILSDAGQRVKYSPPTQKSSRPSTPAAPAPPLPKKDRGKDRQSGSAEMSFAGPLAAAEFERLKKENELLKSSLSEQRKAVKKHAKVCG